MKKLKIVFFTSLISLTAVFGLYFFGPALLPPEFTDLVVQMIQPSDPCLFEYQKIQIVSYDGEVEVEGRKIHKGKAANEGGIEIYALQKFEAGSTLRVCLTF